MDYTTRIRSLREDHDYTQSQIASILHVGQRTYADYESGKTRIPLPSMIRLAEFYDVNMDYICGISNVKIPFPHK
ncbi:MAG: helix-turn-helix transcriptional regulator [Eubacteriales bacterium]|nr:helix-turn-helix transcriptional regulator [Eubacteriales bacterium]